MCCMKDYEEEEHQNDSEEEGRQPSLGRHGTGVRADEPVVRVCDSRGLAIQIAWQAGRAVYSDHDY